MMSFKTNNNKKRGPYQGAFLHLNNELSISLTQAKNQTTPEISLGYNF